MTKRTILLVSVVLLAGACARGGAAGEDLRVVPLNGDVFLLDGDERSSVDGARDIDLGTVVGTGEDGRARIVLTDGRTVELAPKSSLRIDALHASELLTGQALVTAPAGLEVTSGAARIEGTGDFRLDRYVGALRLGVYAGSASVEGWDGRVASLQQVGVAAGIVPDAPVPLRVDPSDAWDTRELGEAINLGLQLDDLQRGLKPQLDRNTPLATVTGLLPNDFPAQASTDRLRGIEPSEALVAAMLALQAAREDGISPLTALQRVVELRELGASWIIVVAQWELYSRAILGALAKVTGLVASALVPVVATGTSDTPTGGSAPASTGTSTTDTGSGSGSSDQPPDTGGGEGGGDTGNDGGGNDNGGGGGDRGETCGSEVECAVEDVIGDAGGIGGDLGVTP